MGVNELGWTHLAVKTSYTALNCHSASVFIVGFDPPFADEALKASILRWPGFAHFGIISLVMSKSKLGPESRGEVT